MAVDLLHLDDLGAEKQTEWVLEQLYSLVNERYEEERSIVVTTNLIEIGRAEQQIGPRTVSRLTEIDGTSFRSSGRTCASATTPRARRSAKCARPRTATRPS